MRFGRRRDRRGRQCLRLCVGVIGRPQLSVPERKRTCPGNDVYARAATHARGRQRLRPCNDRCHVEGMFFHKHPKLQRSGDNVYVRATTSTSRRQRLRSCDDECHIGGVFFHKHPKLQRSGDDVRARATTSRSCFSNAGIFSYFGNPKKTFPLSLFENYLNCVEDGNPKLFLLVGVFLSALNCDLAFLSRHLSI